VLNERFGLVGTKELPFQGVYRFRPSTGELTLLVDSMDTPNGLAFSLDESELFVDCTKEKNIRVFPVKEDGTLGEGRLFAEGIVDEAVPGHPDGLKLDSLGNVYVTGPAGIWIFSPEGEKIGVIETPEFCANFSWGGADWKSLFITASSGLYRLRVNVPGIAREA